MNLMRTTITYKTYANAVAALAKTLTGAGADITTSRYLIAARWPIRSRVGGARVHPVRGKRAYHRGWIGAER